MLLKETTKFFTADSHHHYHHQKEHCTGSEAFTINMTTWLLEKTHIQQDTREYYYFNPPYKSMLKYKLCLFMV